MRVGTEPQLFFCLIRGFFWSFECKEMQLSE